MSYGKLITRFTTGGHGIFITLGLSVHAFCGTGDENIIPTCRSAGNYCIRQDLEIRNLLFYNGILNHAPLSSFT